MNRQNGWFYGDVGRKMCVKNEDFSPPPPGRVVAGGGGGRWGLEEAAFFWSVQMRRRLARIRRRGHVLTDRTNSRAGDRGEGNSVIFDVSALFAFAINPVPYNNSSGQFLRSLSFFTGQRSTSVASVKRAVEVWLVISGVMMIKFICLRLIPSLRFFFFLVFKCLKPVRVNGCWIFWCVTIFAIIFHRINR